MTLRDHKAIGQILCGEAIRYRKLVREYADCVFYALTDSERNKYTVKFKAALLVYGMLEELCKQYDFDLTYEGDFEDE